MASWPGGARGALCLSFDNLGEAAEIELGALAPDDPSVGEHPTATEVLPETARARSAITSSPRPSSSRGSTPSSTPWSSAPIHLQNHEVAYHAWRHEQWGELSAAEQADNLGRGIAAFRGLGGGAGVELAGMRPPGGQLGAGGVDVVRKAGLRYCSPAGAGAGVEDGIALLPFQWRHVDAACVLPPLAPVRERMTGSPDPLDPDVFLAYLKGEIERLSREGGFATIIFHLFMLDWLGEDRLGELLNHVREARSRGDLWIATCEHVAEHVLAHLDEFRDGTTLDPTNWA